MATHIDARWQIAKSFTLPGLQVSLSQPVLVRRTRRYSWFPSLFRSSNGDLYAGMSAYGDLHVSSSTMFITRSHDGGLTWDEPRVAIDGGDTCLELPSGEIVLLPYYLRPKAEGMGAPCNVIAPDGIIGYVSEGVTVTGWPRPNRPFAPEIGTCGFVFNGQVVTLRNGDYLTTLYGYFDDDLRMSLVTAFSPDGMHWTIRSVVADSNCSLAGNEGPCESAICRLADGRIMCIFRLDSFQPFGQTWSNDEGLTWSPPQAMATTRSVEPSLAVLEDGIVTLSGGRKGLYLWLNADGTGNEWQEIDMQAHHNACLPQDRIKEGDFAGTSSYTEIVAIDETHLLYIYDRLANGWQAIPDEMDDTNSVWVVRVQVERQ